MTYHKDHGDPIPGSRLFRAYCAGCGEPIRVTGEALKHPSLCRCEHCGPRRPTRGHVMHRGVGFDAQDVPEIDDGNCA